MRFAAGAFALVLLALAVHYDALDGWWLSDDPQVLLQAMLESPASVLFEPHAYRSLSTSSFTPLVTISFDADLELAGIRPAWFYWHQLLALTAASVLLFLLLARFKGKHSIGAAWLAAAAFLVSPAAVHAVRTLMIRHYVEGLAFALGALLAWDLWCTDKDRRRWLIAAASALYLLALLSKEVYAPLPLLMIWIAIARKVSWRSAALAMAPLAAVAAGYIPWRVYMLGTTGGYGALDPLQAIGLAFSRISSTALGPLPAWAYTIAGVAVGLLIFLGIADRARPALLFILLGGIALALPLAGLSEEYDLRYAFAATAFAFGALGLIAAAGPRRLIAPLAVVALVAAAGGWIYERSHENGVRAMVAEGEYLWSKPQSAPPLLGTAPPWYFAGLAELRALDDRGRSPLWLMSYEGFMLGGISADRAVRSDAAAGAIRPLTQGEHAAIAREQSRFSPAGEMDIRIEMVNNEMSWKLSPAGPYAYLTIPQYAKFPMPETGTRRLPEANQRQSFRIRRDLPNGRWTVSPVLLMPGNNGTVTYRRAE